MSPAPSIRRAASATVLAVLVSALVMLLPGDGLLGVAPSVGHAQVPGGSDVATARLQSVTPAIAERGDTLRLSGTVTNTSERRLTDPLPALRWSSDPVQTLDDLTLVGTNPLFRYGRIDYRYADPLPSLEAGDSATFSIEVPLAGLPLGSGVYVLGVDVLASLPDGLRVFVASTRTTVPVDVEPEEPLPVAMLWPLAAAPSLLTDGLLTSDQVAADLTPDGRLTSLLETGKDAPVTWVVDPDLVVTAQALQDGAASATSAPGAGGADADRFVSDLASALGVADDVRAIPVADPDVGGLLAAGKSVADTQADMTGAPGRDAVAEVAARPVPALAMLADRTVSTDMVLAYGAAGVDNVVLDSRAVAPRSVGPRSPLTAAGEAVDSVDAVLAQAPPEPADGADPALSARQWLVSSTAVQSSVQSGSTDDPSGLVVAPPLRWSGQQVQAQAASLINAWLDTPWVTPVPLEALGVSASPVALVATGTPTPIDPTILDTLTILEDDVTRLAPLFAEPPLDSAELAAVEARSTSYAWQDDPAAGVSYAGEAAATVADVEARLSVVVSPSITLSSRSGRFPVTLVNDSEADVVLGVDFASQNTSRLRVEAIDPVLLTAGEKRTVTATAIATANGRLQVTATPVTTQGQAVGTSASATVDVTNAGALGWAVIGLGGLLLVSAVVRSRLRRRHGTSPDEERAA